MSRLSDLYQAIETLRKEGLMINEDLEKQVSELEEEIIKKEILPIITETIAPALEPVKRELVLVVDYVPDAPLSVHISRKRNFAAAITDAKEIVPDTVVTPADSVAPDPLTVHTNGSKKSHIRESGNTLLKLTYSDGEVIKENIAWQTFYKFVVRAGIDKVRALNRSVCKVPLVSNTLDSKYAVCQKDLGGGWYLMTHGSTKDKKKLIEQIAKALDIDVKVEIVPK